MMGRDVLFQMGNDEHSQNVFKRAVEPLRELPADRPVQSAMLKTWNETKEKGRP